MKRRSAFLRPLQCGALIFLAVTGYTAPDKPKKANGIYIHEVKRYDERELAIMLRGIEAALAQKSFFDQAKILNATGAISGGIATSSGIAFSAAAGVLDIQEVLKTSFGKNAAGQTEETPTSRETTTKNGGTVDKPKIEAVDSPKLMTPTVAASDLLAEQVALSYQAVNLRLLLQRAITDRYLHDPFDPNRNYTWQASPDEARQRRISRGQALVGFDISIEPPPNADGAVAEVEVTVRSASEAGIQSLGGNTALRLSLVGLYPQEKTYNVATIANKSQAFSLGGIVSSIFNLGLSTSNASSEIFLVKDTDTVALTRAPEHSEGKDAAKFLWQFRPVLGQKTVTPGTRSVFAQLALPVRSGAAWEGEATIRTRWRKYDRRKGIVGDVITTIPVTTQEHIRISSPELPIDRVYAFWAEEIDSMIRVELFGRNLNLGPRISAGGLTLAVGDGLTELQNDSRMHFLVPGNLLLDQRVDLFAPDGRDFPVWIPLTPPKSGKEFNPSERPEPIVGSLQSIHAARIGQTDRCRVTLKVNGVKDAKEPVLVRIGRKIYGLPSRPISCTTDSAWVGTFQFTAPLEEVKQAAELSLYRVAWGPDFADRMAFGITEPSPSKALAVSGMRYLSGDGEMRMFALEGANFRKLTKDEDPTATEVLLNGKRVVQRLGTARKKEPSLSFVNGGLMLLTLPADQVKSVREILVQHKTGDNEEVVFATLPEIEEENPYRAEPSTLYCGDSSRIAIVGPFLNKVKSIRIDGEKIPASRMQDGKFWVELPPAFTQGKPGKLELLIETEDCKYSVVVTVEEKKGKGGSK